MNFFDSVRAQFGSLDQGQVDGFNVLLNATAGLPIAWRAYIIATAWHESAATMQPITERGPRKYFNMYEPPSKKAKALGNTLKGDGYKFRGRGYVQITGRANYAKASTVTGVNLVASPDRALEADLAAVIILNGMTRGWFTGKKLGDYPQGDFVNMRRVVNGQDRAGLIASYATKFEAALVTQKQPLQPVPHIPAPMAPRVAESQPKPAFEDSYEYSERCEAELQERLKAEAALRPPPPPKRPWWKFWG